MTDAPTDPLDPIFHALSDGTRRAILRQLATGEAPVRVLAAPFPISIQAVSKHIQVLARAGLVEREVRGREHYCRLQPAGLRTAQAWLTWYEAYWTPRLDAFAGLFPAPATGDTVPGAATGWPGLGPATEARPVPSGAALAAARLDEPGKPDGSGEPHGPGAPDGPAGAGRAP